MSFEVSDGMTNLAQMSRQARGEEGFANASGSDEDELEVLGEPMTLSPIENLSFGESSGSGIIDRAQGGRGSGQGKLGRFEPTLLSQVRSSQMLTFHQQSQALIKT